MKWEFIIFVLDLLLLKEKDGWLIEVWRAIESKKLCVDYYSVLSLYVEVSNPLGFVLANGNRMTTSRTMHDLPRASFSFRAAACLAAKREQVTDVVMR